MSSNLLWLSNVFGVNFTHHIHIKVIHYLYLVVTCLFWLLRHIAGLNANRAKNIIEWREKNGPFINREQLKDVKGLGPKSYQQCAGFIRVNQEYIRTFCSQTSELAAGSQKAATNEKQGKKKNKAAANVTWQPNPLDQTCIHPESYNTAMSTAVKPSIMANMSDEDPGSNPTQIYLSLSLSVNSMDLTSWYEEECFKNIEKYLIYTYCLLSVLFFILRVRFLTHIGGSPSEIGKPEMQQKVNAVIEREGMEGIAKRLNTIGQTLQIIIDGLTQPEGFDIRKDFDKPDFKRSIVCLEDLSVGTVLTGRVENATLFGVFVDIGVGRAGLIPIRSITEDKLSKAKKRRSLGLGPGEKVEVKVHEINIPRSRITLDLIRVL
ncbi:hypothetical protein JD844_025380 [Phrynosoma platyrhinos]|uniref:S1 motif domain-containing protein n=1 Tax=Phrynosoma platyrhinos TaxID=52577 RepID=A0ABQ7SZG3_PHRPL|nr:hypothetical protein JD844_025380 [Phrynosoma platyrhinos]